MNDEYDNCDNDGEPASQKQQDWYKYVQQKQNSQDNNNNNNVNGNQVEFRPSSLNSDQHSKLFDQNQSVDRVAALPQNGLDNFGNSSIQNYSLQSVDRSFVDSQEIQRCGGIQRGPQKAAQGLTNKEALGGQEQDEEISDMAKSPVNRGGPAQIIQLVEEQKLSSNHGRGSGKEQNRVAFKPSDDG